MAASDNALVEIDCQGCGSVLPPSPHGHNVYGEDDELTCSECCAVNQLSIDDDRDEVYVSQWRCGHGVDGGGDCAACEPSEGVTHA